MQEKNKRNTEISVRISQMIDFLGINPNLFAKKLGYERSQSIYDVMNGKSAPSYDFFYKFEISEYSEIINISWLLTGREPMLRETKRQNSTTTALVPIAQKTDAQYESSNKKGNEQENPKIINELLTRLENQSKEIGRLETNISHLKEELTDSWEEIGRLQRDNEQLKKYADCPVDNSTSIPQTLKISEPASVSISK